MNKELQDIPYGKIPTVLLVGNGINYCFEKVSWDALLDKITERDVTAEEKAASENLPYPLRVVALTRDKVDRKLKGFAETMLATGGVEDEQQKLTKDLIERFSPDIVLTTNYTYEIEHCYIDGFAPKIGRADRHRHKTVGFSSAPCKRNLYEYFRLNEDLTCWHIHGEAAKPDSMVLGHYYYGKQLKEIENYIPDFLRRYKGCAKAKRPYAPKSWIDYFMIGKVFVVGFGMSDCEMDFWWLANCKKRHQLNGEKITAFTENINAEKRLLAECYGIDIQDAGVMKDGYKERFMNLAKRLPVDE